MQKKNTSGTVLTAVVVTSLVVLTLVGGMFSIAYSYYMRSYNEVAQRQAQLSARSACELIGKEIYTASDTTDYKKFIPAKTGDIVTLSSFKLINNATNKEDSDFKKVTLNGSVEKTNDTTLKITITAKYKNASATSTLTMLKDKADDTSWQLGKLK
jgi:type II secretory pathway pseudopilin PulG